MRRPLPAAIAIAALVLLLSALGRADLFNPDEPREAEIAREMWSTGDLVVPRLNGDPFLEKPPLFYWLVAASYRFAGGPGELPARLAPALAAGLCVLLTVWFGRRLVGDRAALLGAAFLLTSFQFLWTARRCMIDMPLTLMVMIACGALHRGLDERGRRRAGWLVLGYAATGAAVLLKGIIGAGIPALALAGYLAARRDWRGVARSWLVPGMAAAILPVALWTALLGHRLGSAAVHDFVWVNNVLRFLGGASRGHVQPFFYYVPTLLLELAPWSLLVPPAVASAAARLRGAVPSEGAAGPPREQEGLLYLLSWLLLPFVVLSIASTKRGIYLLPIYPAAALLAGWWVHRVAADAPSAGAARPGGERRSWERIGSRAALALLLATTIAVSAAIPALLRAIRPDDRAARLAALSILASLGVAGYFALRRGQAVKLSLLAASAVGVVHLATLLLIVPEIVNRFVSPRSAARQIRRMSEAGDRPALYRFKEGALGGYLFYAGMTLPHFREPADLRRHLASGGASLSPRSLAVMREEVYETVGPSLGLATTIVRRFDPGLRTPTFALPFSSTGPPVVPRDGEAIVMVAAEPERGASSAPRGPDDVPEHEVSYRRQPADR